MTGEMSQTIRRILFECLLVHIAAADWLCRVQILNIVHTLNTTSFPVTERTLTLQFLQIAIESCYDSIQVEGNSICR